MGVNLVRCPWQVLESGLSGAKIYHGSKRLDVEWVYQVIVSALSDLQTTTSEIENQYRKCLDQYVKLSNLLGPDAGRTLFVLFIQ